MHNRIRNLCSTYLIHHNLDWWNIYIHMYIYQSWSMIHRCKFPSISLKLLLVCRFVCLQSYFCLRFSLFHFSFIEWDCACRASVCNCVCVWCLLIKIIISLCFRLVNTNCKYARAQYNRTAYISNQFDLQFVIDRLIWHPWTVNDSIRNSIISHVQCTLLWMFHLIRIWNFISKIKLNCSKS